MTPKKTPSNKKQKATKTSGKSSGRPLVPQPHGGALKPGGDGVSGGRPRDEFKAWCRNLLDDRMCRRQVEEILADKKHPAFKSMWSAVADRAHGKAKESVEISGPNSGPLVVQFMREGKKRTAG